MLWVRAGSTDVPGIEEGEEGGQGEDVVILLEGGRHRDGGRDGREGGGGGDSASRDGGVAVMCRDGEDSEA